jgi:hypothetical protein
MIKDKRRLTGRLARHGRATRALTQEGTERSVRLGGSDDFEQLSLLPQSFEKQLAGELSAATATGAATGLLGQFTEFAHPVADSLADVGISNRITNAYVHIER